MINKVYLVIIFQNIFPGLDSSISAYPKTANGYIMVIKPAAVIILRIMKEYAKKEKLEAIALKIETKFCTKRLLNLSRS